jgi:hypothetical protein
MTKMAGSGSISQRHGSADPDPDPSQNVMDPQHWWREGLILVLTSPERDEHGGAHALILIKIIQSP